MYAFAQRTNISVDQNLFSSTHFQSLLDIHEYKKKLINEEKT